MLVETSSRLLKDLCTRELMEKAEGGEWPRVLWDSFDVAGLTLAARAEARGGPGADFSDMCALVRMAGRARAHCRLSRHFSPSACWRQPTFRQSMDL